MIDNNYSCIFNYDEFYSIIIINYFKLVIIIVYIHIWLHAWCFTILILAYRRCIVSENVVGWYYTNILLKLIYNMRNALHVIYSLGMKLTYMQLSLLGQKGIKSKNFHTLYRCMHGVGFSNIRECMLHNFNPLSCTEQYFDSTDILARLRNLGRFQNQKRHSIELLVLHLFVQFYSYSICIM